MASAAISAFHAVFPEAVVKGCLFHYSQGCLNTPPQTGDLIVDANLGNFRDYFVRQWLMDREKALLWNHFDRTGPRKTNHANGYHMDFAQFSTPDENSAGNLYGKDEGAASRDPTGRIKRDINQTGKHISTI